VRRPPALPALAASAASALILLGTGAAPALAATPSPVLPPSIVVSAHRGGSAYAPENTMLAERNAVRVGADQLETDTQLTSDGALVLIHDATLDRTTDCTGNVIDHTLAQVRACDAAYWWSPGQATTVPDPARAHPLRGHGVQVPLASELFADVASLGAADTHTISIEIKDIPGEANFDPTGTLTAAKLVPAIQASGLKARTIVQSFYPPALTVVRQLDPTIATQLLTIGAASPYLAYGAVGGETIVSPSSSSPDLTSSFVSTAHALGKQVIPYTPDTAAELTTTGQKGVDGEITNYPACLLELEGRPHPAQLLPAVAVAAGAAPVAVCAAEPAPVGLPEAPWPVLLLALPGLAFAGVAAARRRHERDTPGSPVGAAG